MYSYHSHKMAQTLKTNANLLGKYLTLSQLKEQTQITYVWIDGRQGMRSKTKTVSFVPRNVSDLPIWNYGGCATYQSQVENGDLLLLPVALYNDPFRGGNNKMILCECISPEMTPLESNTRHTCNLTMDLVADQEPWFGIEQEYYLLNGQDQKRPLGWPVGGFPDLQGDYYCGVGAESIVGRDLVEAHYRACMYAGVTIAGANAETMPSQWEFQIGTCKGVTIGDDLWMARYILYRVAEDFHVKVTLDPKFLEGDWSGAGAHANFSTKSMREPGGVEQIKKAINKLQHAHQKHIVKYDLNGGADNVRRLTGKNCTSVIDTFSFGVADRGVSVRIPRQVENEGCGYLEDRRPASNMDPYTVAEQLVRTICLNE